MYRTRMLATLLTTAFLICCPAFFQTHADSRQDNRIEDKPISPAASELQSVITGLTNPLYVIHAHDGTNRLFILEQAGRIRVAQPGANTSTVFLDIVSKVLSGGERGLLGLAFHPQYPVNGRFFVYYTRQTDGALTIAEYQVSSDPNVADPNSEILFNGNFPIPHSANNNHNGGCMQFGPDGFLYVGTGDGGSSNDPPNNAQNINVMLGKILRLDVDTPNGTVVYSSPPSNPFAGPTAGLDEIYAFGMRNPWRFSFDRGTGRLFVADVGQDAFEEVDIVQKGGNYGWNIMEGMHCFNPPSGCNTAGLILPITEYSHAEGNAVIGGFVYRGSNLPTLRGVYIFGDLGTGKIFALQETSSNVFTRTPLLTTGKTISSFGQDQAGELYLVDIGAGTIFKLAPN